MIKNPYPKGSTEAAMWDYENATNDYTKNGYDDYSWLEDLSSEKVDSLPTLQNSGLSDIQGDQRLNDMELSALAELEAQSRDGLSARDKADLAQVESQANRANAGRQGAIKQDMAARGLGGSGLDFMSRQQAAQDSYEMEALAGLEKAAMAQDGRRDATSRIGSMAGQMGERDFARKAQAAQAQDVINRFNTGSEIDRKMYNNQLANDTNRFNSQGRQGVANNSVQGRNNFAADSLGARQGLAQLQYNSAAEAKNQAEAAKKERERKRKGQMGAMLGVAGGVVGGVYGGPAGAAVGYQAGNGLGQSFAHGGEVQGDAMFPGDHPMNDTVNAQLSPGEVVVPRSLADDPEAAGEFVAEVKGDNGADKAVEGLLAAMNYLSNQKRR